MGWRQADPALGGDARPGMDDDLAQGQRQCGVARVQRQGDARAYGRDEYRHAALGRRRAEGRARAQRRQDDVLHVPHLVDDELRRLPSADPGELEDRAPPLRRRRDAQFRDLQPAGRARRHVPARRAWRDQGSQDRAGTLVLGADPVIDQHQSREDLCPATADFVGGFQFAGVRAALPAHRAQDRDQGLRRLPSVQGQRQQRDHGAAAAARDQLRQLRRLQRLGRRGRAASPRCRSPNGTSRRR